MSEIENATKAVGENAAAGFNRTVAGLKDGVTNATVAYRDMSDKAAKGTGEAVAFQQGTWQAYAEAGQIWASGSQELFRQWTASSQHAMHESLTNMRALMGVRTPKEAIELQGNLVRTAAVWAVSESAKLAHAGIELAEKAAAPLTARAVKAAEKVSAFKA